MSFPDYLADSVRRCGHGHSTIRATTKCPICARRRKASPPNEPAPRSLDPEPWATGYGAERARQSRRRGIEKSREVRRSA